MKKKLKKALQLLMCCVIAMGMLAGCSSGATNSGNSGSEDTTTPTSDAVETPDSDSEEESSSGGADRSETLTIYTNSGSDGRGEWLTEKAAEAGFNINVMHLGGSELTERLIAEKNNQIADVVFGLNAMNFERIKAQDILTPYTPSWVGNVDVALGDADEGYYYPLVVQALIITYNSDVYTEETAPTGFTDLQMGSAYEGLHHILALTGGTCQAVLASILVQYTDENGLYGISDEGWKVIESFVKSGEINHDEWWNEEVSGELPIAMLWSSGYLQRLSEYGTENIDYVSPEIGSPFVVEQVGICNNSDKQELAQEFVDWFGSDELQSEWAQTFDSYPANKLAQQSASQAAQDLMNNVTQQPIDWAFVAENIEQWVEKIMLEYV